MTGLKLVSCYEFTNRYERITDSKKSEVLKLELLDSTKATALAKIIETYKNVFGKYRLYNVDLSPAQAYLYEHDLFPLALCDIYYDKNNTLNKIVNRDNIWNTDFIVPQFRTVLIKVNTKKDSNSYYSDNNNRDIRYSNAIKSILISIGNDENNDNQYNRGGNDNINIRNRNIKIDYDSEKQILNAVEDEILRIDPDFIFTEDGDSFTFPYLIHRAKMNGNKKLSLSRDSMILHSPIKEGTSYSSYSRIYFKPSTTRLYGRIHFDPLQHLIFTKIISMSANEYQNRNTIEKNSLDLLRSECNKHIRAGEILQYVITDYYKKHSKIKSIPVQLINEKATIYDTRRYVELLIQICNSVTKPFGYSCSMPVVD